MEGMDATSDGMSDAVLYLTVHASWPIAIYLIQSSMTRQDTYVRHGVEVV